MKITGVIAEYNPFHQGHAFHLQKTKELTGADYLLVVMSGNYVQRGTPAMFDKYVRAEAALRSGADLVLELPVSAATGSAEYFAEGAVRLLQDTGIVTDLCFGTEQGSLSGLCLLADLLVQEPDSYQQLLRSFLKQGLSFPAARAQAVQAYAPELPADLLSEPNNLLALEYLKALKRLNSSIEPHTIRREGSHYHDPLLANDSMASASAIRAALLQTNGHFSENLLRQLPSPDLYQDWQGLPPMTEDAFSLPLLQKLRMIQDQPLTDYFGVTPELSNRIWNRIDAYPSFSGFTDLLKTRELTRTSVSRALLHILLDIHAFAPADCFRVLGFRKDASKLLHLLSEHGQLPIVCSLSEQLPPSFSLYPDHLYESVRSLLHGKPFRNEYRRKLITI